MSPRLLDLGLTNLPFPVFVRKASSCGGGTDPRDQGARVRPPGLSRRVNRRPHYLEAAPGPLGEASTRAVVRFSKARRPTHRRRTASSDREARLCRSSAVIEPLAVYGSEEDAPVGAGLAISILSPDGFELRAIGVRASGGSA